MQTDDQYTVGILADDLTSAADGAVPFAVRGQRALVGRRRLPRQDGMVLAIDSGSRSVAVSLATERVAQLTLQLASCDILFKTVDSTLRGHVSSELEAAFAASGRKSLVFAPAFPAAGRTTVHGIQLVDGVPVADTVYGRDPVHPARHSALIDLVPTSIRSVKILNAATQEDLDKQVAALAEPKSILWAGSPGMATALARRFVRAPASSVMKTGKYSEVLVVIGSANPRSQRQADAIKQAVDITLVRSPSARANDPISVLHQIADEAVKRFRSGRFGTLIATGGDTLEAIMDRLEITEFEILQELEPGFPVGRAWLNDGSELIVAMKAGGFGDDDTLRRAIAKLRQGAALAEPEMMLL